MSDKIKYKNNGDDKGQITYIVGKQVSTNWRFVSNGTWFDEGSQPKLERDCGWMGGSFRGIRTSQYPCEVNCGEPLGSKYEDEEFCDWIEFDIYDESGTLLRKADPYDEVTVGIKYIDVNFKIV